MNNDEILKELDSLLNYQTPIVKIDDQFNNIYVKKEDCIPFSFGGNKCRIAANYFKQIIGQGNDVIVTYGTSNSNLCRVIANMSYRFGVKCIIVSPEEKFESSPNSEIVEYLGASVVKCPVGKVKSTINDIMCQFHKTNNPYFIYGGGHGWLGTDSYRVVMRQIIEYERNTDIKFDYIFITLATGTSMSGLIVENEFSQYGKKLIGISVAREENRAISIMNEALEIYDPDLSGNFDSTLYEIVGDYRCDGYGTYNDEILDEIKMQFAHNGLYLDTTYTGKSFYGMRKYLEKNKVSGKNILFIHTGGSPLFFKEGCKYLNKQSE